MRVPWRARSILGLGDGRAHVGDARHDRAQRREVGTDGGRQQPCQAGLPGAGRSPQEQAGQVAAGDAPAERAALADEVGLADELVEGPGSHPRGERLSLGRWLEQRLGTRALGSTGGGHGPMVARARGPTAAVTGRIGPVGPVPSDLDAGDDRDDVQHDQQREQDAADRRDPPDVADDVGVLVGGLDGQRPSSGGGRSRSAAASAVAGWRSPPAPRPRSGPRARRPGPPPARSGSPAAERRRGDGLGRRRRGRRGRGSDSAALERGSLPRSGAAAANAFGHDAVRASRGCRRADAGSGRRSRGLPAAEDSTPPVRGRRGEWRVRTRC